MEVFSYPNQDRSEAQKTSCLRTDIHPNKLPALAFAEIQRRQGLSCRVYERSCNADNRILSFSVTVTREPKTMKQACSKGDD